MQKRIYTKKDVPVSAGLFPVLPTIMVSVKGTKTPFDKANIITIGRATSLTTTPPCVCISVKDCRFSYEQILQSEEFVLNFADEQLLHAADLCGVHSGSRIDKFKECGLTAVSMKGLNYAPEILEAPLSLGCRLVEKVYLHRYGIFIGEIVTATAASQVLNMTGKPDTDLVGTLVFDGISADYRKAGDHLAEYGVSVRKKPKE